MATTFSANRSALFFLFSSFFFRPTIDPEEIETDSFYFSFSFFYLFLVLLVLLFLVFLFCFFFIFNACGKYFFVQTLSIVADSVSVVLGGRGQFARRRLADFISIFFWYFLFSFWSQHPLSPIKGFIFTFGARISLFFGAFLAFFGGPPPHQVPPPPPLSFSFSFVCFIFYFLFFGRNLKNPTPARPYLPDVSGKKIKK